MEVIEAQIDEQKIIDGRVFPLALFPSEEHSKDDLLTWAKENQEWLRKKLLEYGALLLRGFRVDSPHDFEELIDVAGFPRMPYIGGAAPRSSVTSRVLTSNESPPTEPIPFHHEMAQVPNPPAYIFFYCDLPPNTYLQALPHQAVVLPQIYSRIGETVLCFVGCSVRSLSFYQNDAYLPEKCYNKQSRKTKKARRFAQDPRFEKSTTTKVHRFSCTSAVR